MKIITISRKFTSGKKHSGFTIIELMVVVAIVGITAAFAFPSFQTVLKNRTIASTGASIISILQTARTEAITRSTKVTTCFSASNSAGTAACIEPSNGATLYLLAFIDTEVVPNNKFDAGDTLISATNAFNDDIIFYQSTTDATITTGDYIEFNQRGSAKFESGATNASAYFSICDDRNKNNFSRLISLSASGRVSISVINTNSAVKCE